SDGVGRIGSTVSEQSCTDRQVRILGVAEVARLEVLSGPCAQVTQQASRIERSAAAGPKQRFILVFAVCRYAATVEHYTHAIDSLRLLQCDHARGDHVRLVGRIERSQHG